MDRRVSPGRSLRREPAPEVADKSLKASPAASTAAFNGVRIPGEKTSLMTPHITTSQREEGDARYGYKVLRAARAAVLRGEPLRQM